jgi:putative monooxygenase
MPAQTPHPKAERAAGFFSVDQAKRDTRRGGEIMPLLSPMTVGSTSGFMGVAKIAPGDRISEHYHPYSEEFVFVVRGTITADLDDEPHTVAAGEAMMIPINMRHRLRNEGDEEVFMVFHMGPLAPEPPLGHVDTE